VNSKRLLLPLLAVVLAVVAGASALAAASGPPKRRASSEPPQAHAKAQSPKPRVSPVLVRRLRGNVWRWQAVMGVRRSNSTAALRTVRALRYWRVQARHVRRLAAHPPHKRGWNCIHRYEGSWGDSGDPYWGGLQMDRGFMRSYAPPVLLRRGWANHWTALEQMWVAERAHRSGRGYWPWPSTARFCGLL
jgi:hypothetical protein